MGAHLEHEQVYHYNADRMHIDSICDKYLTPAGAASKVPLDATKLISGADALGVGVHRQHTGTTALNCIHCLADLLQCGSACCNKCVWELQHPDGGGRDAARSKLGCC